VFLRERRRGLNFSYFVLHIEGAGDLEGRQIVGEATTRRFEVYSGDPAADLRCDLNQHPNPCALRWFPQVNPVRILVEI
jgi:hypothetical protein